MHAVLAISLTLQKHNTCWHYVMYKEVFYMPHDEMPANCIQSTLCVMQTAAVTNDVIVPTVVD